MTSLFFYNKHGNLWLCQSVKHSLTSIFSYALFSSPFPAHVPFGLRKQGKGTFRGLGGQRNMPYPACCPLGKRMRGQGAFGGFEKRTPK